MYIEKVGPTGPRACLRTVRQVRTPTGVALCIVGQSAIAVPTRHPAEFALQILDGLRVRVAKSTQTGRPQSAFLASMTVFYRSDVIRNFRYLAFKPRTQ